MRQILRTSALAIACVISLAAPARLTAQTTLSSTFGTGDSYDPGLGWLVSPRQGIAQSFVVGSTDMTLTGVRLALFESGSPYTIEFWAGADMNTATLLESWTGTLSTNGILSLASLVMPNLISGNTFWLSAHSATDGGWFLNDQDIKGVTYQSPAGGPWANSATIASAAYDVTGINTVPEPATLLLLGSGLAGLAPMIRRRRKSSTV